MCNKDAMNAYLSMCVFICFLTPCVCLTDIPEEHRIDLFIGTLNDNLQHEIHILEPDSLEKAFRLARKIECKIMETRKTTTHMYKDGSVATPRLPQPTRLTPQQLE